MKNGAFDSWHQGRTGVNALLACNAPDLATTTHPTDCSSMLTGSHNAKQLPVVLLGRGGNQLETGRVLDYREKPNRKMCSLYLSLLDKFGIRLEKFGDSSERLAEI